MPIHGLKSDLELAVLAVTAGLVSFFATGEVFSNVLFGFLLASLFFLEGLHFDISELRTFHDGKSTIASLIAVAGIIPLLSFGVAHIYPRFSQFFLVLGVSSVSLGSPLVWSNISGGNGNLTGYLSSVLLAMSLVIVPALIFFLPVSVSLGVVAQNLFIVLVPFLAGLILHNSKFEPLEDARFHFSKLAFWLIVLITFVQLQLVLESKAVVNVVSYTALTFVIGFYVLFSFLSGYIVSKISGLNEKNSRSIGFVSGTRNIGIAFYIGSLINGEVVLLVGIYYFVRQIVGIGIADFLMHDELKYRERLGF